MEWDENEFLSKRIYIIIEKELKINTLYRRVI